MNTETIAEKMLDLGKLSLRFARVDRATYHEDGVRRESDTDHTVMLGLCACAFASSYDTTLNLGKVAQFAFIHDLVEAYAGDTNSLGMVEDIKKVKEEREHEAFLKIKEEFKDVFPWIHTTIEEYESLATPEAKFIKAFDKIMPKVTQVLNNGVQFKHLKRTQEELTAIHKKQLDEMTDGYAKELPETLELLSVMMGKAEETVG
jgi:putative hydrolase of HD superfamily